MAPSTDSRLAPNSAKPHREHPFQSTARWTVSRPDENATQGKRSQHKAPDSQELGSGGRNLKH